MAVIPDSGDYIKEQPRSVQISEDTLRLIFQAAKEDPAKFVQIERTLFARGRMQMNVEKLHTVLKR